jgi:hypothetical protein
VTIRHDAAVSVHGGIDGIGAATTMPFEDFVAAAAQQTVRSRQYTDYYGDSWCAVPGAFPYGSGYPGARTRSRSGWEPAAATERRIGAGP